MKKPNTGKLSKWTSKTMEAIVIFENVGRLNAISLFGIFPVAGDCLLRETGNKNPNLLYMF